MGVLAVTWGVVVVVLSTICWGGQVVSAFAPERAMRWGLQEDESAVDPAFAADARGEARWDVVTLWPMILAGVLLAVGHAAWAPIALAGGGAYLYFAGRGILVRLELRRRGLRIGTPDSVRVGLVALGLWGAMAAITIAAALVALAS